MRVADLVKDGEPATLSHPIVGLVSWGEIGPGEGFHLYFKEGPEAGRALLADDVVIHDDQWRKND